MINELHFPNYFQCKLGALKEALQRTLKTHGALISQAAGKQDRTLIERRYASENKLLHAIAKGDPHMLKTAMGKGRGSPGRNVIPMRLCGR